MVKEKIRKAALKLFSEKGFDGCSIRDIAQEAGLNHQKITYHFKTKSDLFSEVLSISFDQLSTLSSNLVLDPKLGNPMDDFKSHLKKVARYFAENPEFLRIIYVESITSSPRFNSIKPLIGAFRNNVEREFLLLREYGYARKFTLNQLILAFSGSFQAWFIHPYMNGVDLIDAEAIEELDSYIDILCDTHLSKS